MQLYILCIISLHHRAQGNVPSWTWSLKLRTWGLTWMPTHPENKPYITLKLSQKTYREVKYRIKDNYLKMKTIWCLKGHVYVEKYIFPNSEMQYFSFAPCSCGDPSWYHPEQHSGWSRDWERARGDPERDARSRDQLAGSGLWLPACYRVPVYSFGSDHLRPYWKHQVRPNVCVPHQWLQGRPQSNRGPDRDFQGLTVDKKPVSILNGYRTINRGDLVDYITTHYKGPRIVLAAAGGTLN